MQKIKCTLIFEKEMKRTWRMREVDFTDGLMIAPEHPIIGALYLRKSYYTQRPKSVTITVEVQE